LACQLASHLLTAIFWGPWQAKLSHDDRGPASPYLERILTTHWLRTLSSMLTRDFFSHGPCSLVEFHGVNEISGTKQDLTA
jgi:hypothetical protein